MIKIDKNVPLPDAHGEIKKTLAKLKVGESFFLPSPTTAGRTGLYRLAKQFDVQLVTRSVDGGLRVWRLA